MRRLEADWSIKLTSVYHRNFGAVVLLVGLALFLVPEFPLVLKSLYTVVGLALLGVGRLSKRRWEGEGKVSDLAIGVGLFLALCAADSLSSMGSKGAGSAWIGLILVYVACFYSFKRIAAFGVLFFLASEFLLGDVWPKIVLSSNTFQALNGLNLAACFAALGHFLHTFVGSTLDAKSQDRAKRQPTDDHSNYFLQSIQGGIAHEINNPLQIINGSASKISRLTFESIRERDAALLFQHKLVNASQLIALFVKSMYSKTENSSYSEPSYFLLSGVIEKILVDLGLIYDTFLEGQESLEVYTNRGKLEQIIRSLCHNAKEAASGNRVANIKINFQMTASGLELLVTDWGSGVDDEHLEAIFDPFFTTKNYELHLGIGLSNSRADAEFLNGALELISAKNPTVFRVWIPQERWNI